MGTDDDAHAHSRLEAHRPAHSYADPNRGSDPHARLHAHAHIGTDTSADDRGDASADDHNISNSLGIAMQRSVEFLDRYVKGTADGHSD